MRISIFKDLEAKLIDLHDRIKKRKIRIDQLPEFRTQVTTYIRSIMSFENSADASLEGLYAVLMICLDQYTYSENGEVLITDTEYDTIHRLYIALGGQQLIYPDPVESRWKMAKHKKPNMVGSLAKVYSKKDLMDYFKWIEELVGKLSQYISWVLAPKFDGISACLEFRDGELIQALTRGDDNGSGREGQDITAMAVHISNIDTLAKKYSTGFLKVELLCPSQYYKRLSSIYANRRSATTAIVNSPKNIEYGGLLYAMPLMFDPDDGTDPIYCPEGSMTIIGSSPSEIWDSMSAMMKEIRDPEFPFRVDGVVIHPITHLRNDHDVMAYSIAYKINTAMNTAKIEYGYVSIGRSGKATPMINIKPTEVNETIVRDVSLGSFQNFEKLMLREDEEVIIYSAGDVIPQMKVQSPRVYPKRAGLLQIPKICPYCAHQLSFDFKCKNPDCSRVITGAITNFLVKLGADSISDGTINALYKAGLVKTLSDVFTLRTDDIAKLTGFGDTSAQNIQETIRSIQRKPIYHSVFYGALGIPGCSTKTFEKIFDVIHPDEFFSKLEKYLKSDKKQRDLYTSIYFMLLDIDGIGLEKRDTIIKYFEENFDEVVKLHKYLNLVVERVIEGEVVFTGFRDPMAEAKFEALGFRPSSSVNKKTVAVMTASRSTTKAQKALTLGIPVFDSYELDQAIAYCEGFLRDKREMKRQLSEVLAVENPD